MQLCGQVCANILLESTSFTRMIVSVHLSEFIHLWKIEKKSYFGFYVVSTITGQKHYGKCVESHKIACAEEIVNY